MFSLCFAEVSAVSYRSRSRWLLWSVLGATCSAASSVCLANDPAALYLTRIKPLFEERCYACHGALKQEGGLRLDTAASAVRGGDSGAAIVAGDANASLLLQRISAADEAERMPPEGEPLTAAQIGSIRDWIQANAVAPADEQPEHDPREHWAFRKPIRPAVPQTKHPDRQRNPIDAFLGFEQEQRGLIPQPEADKRIWLRRVTLDLTGLPPSQAELNTFLLDDSPEAYDKVVTRLLDSPQYGERWGRHWMDIWRYSDWWGLGAEVRNSQKHLWHWRDWIIESLNEDKGYDQMVREMLAADELYPEDWNRLRGTGFLARQYFLFNRTTWLDGVVEHTSKAFLGLTANCAKCHDHKYDPISHQEYYQLRAIFEPYQLRTDFVAGELDAEKNGIPRAFDCNLDAKTFVHLRGDDRRPDESIDITPAVPAVIPDVPFEVATVSLPALAYLPGLREDVVTAHRKAAEQRVSQAAANLVTARKRLAEAANTGTVEPSHVTTETFTDRFESLQNTHWEPREGAWEIAEGKLVQSQAGNVRGALRYRHAPPTDFEATLRYVPTGGNQWKSVGITFDVTESGNEVLAYLSAVSSGSKAQVAYKQNGNQVYPANGLQARAVALNKPHEIVLRVRGNLVNLQIDGEPSVAYRLPIPRQPGALELITYDATAQFLAFELKPLPTDLVLREPSAANSEATTQSAQMTKEQAELGVALAEKVLSSAQAELAAIKARAAADRVKFLGETPELAEDVIAKAVLSERMLAFTKADESVCRAELAVLQAIPDKKEAAEKQLVAAKENRNAAEKALEKSDGPHTPLPGSVKIRESNVESAESQNRPFPTESTGRRSALAQWLTHRDHPLTARVAVNHIWSRHMGKPLVATVFDFGRKGALPTHPELLDWLALEFQEHGCSQKYLHRLIVTSAAYRRTSTEAGADAATLAADPENRWYWRMNPVRMEAQVVRDSLLSLAGELDLTLGGPSIPVNQTTSKRRSLYFVHSHNDHEPFLAMFDDANVLDCYRRAESIVPQQALALENSPLASQMAEKIATRIDSAAGLSDDEFIRQAFLTVLNVEPTTEETELVRQALARFSGLVTQQKQGNPQRLARIRVIHALLNHNDFVTIR